MIPGNTYHVFNHANGWENLFVEPKNYDFFLSKFSLHVLPVVNVYAYCLMPNHFHMSLRIKSSKELTAYFDWVNKGKGMPVQIFSDHLLIKKVSKSFSNLFNSYAQAFNKTYDRMGSLFMQNMKKQEVLSDEYFCRVIHYIHANPVHHGFVKTIDKWPYSSFNSFLDNRPGFLDSEHVFDIFGGRDKFIKYHERPIDLKSKWTGT